MEPKISTIKRLFAMSGNLCAFPGCPVHMVEGTGTVTGEICHIKSQRPDGPRHDADQTDEECQSYGNLILLCARHHKIVDRETDRYSAEAVLKMKSMHERLAGRAEKEQDLFFARALLSQLTRSNALAETINVMIGSPGAIQGHTINLETTKKNVTVGPPIGSIGSDVRLSGYIQHLIKRYNEFASSDPTKIGRFSYGAISKNMEDKFGTQWKLVPNERADDVIAYLQQRISRTRQAKMNKGKGWKAFSTYEEYLAKYNK